MFFALACINELNGRFCKGDFPARIVRDLSEDELDDLLIISKVCRCVKVNFFRGVKKFCFFCSMAIWT